jgi:hypothetical protein
MLLFAPCGLHVHAVFVSRKPWAIDSTLQGGKALT